MGLTLYAESRLSSTSTMSAKSSGRVPQGTFPNQWIPSSESSSLAKDSPSAPRKYAHEHNGCSERFSGVTMYPYLSEFP